MASVSSYKMKRTSLSLQKSCQQRQRTSAMHITHTHEPMLPALHDEPLLTADVFQNPTSMLEPLEKIVLITRRKDSDRQPGQGSYLAFFQFRERRRSVFCQAVRAQSIAVVYIFSSVPLQRQSSHLRDNHTKIFVSWSILARL